MDQRDKKEIINALKKELHDFVAPSYNVAAKTTSNLFADVKSDMKDINKNVEKLSARFEKHNQRFEVFLENTASWRKELEKKNVIYDAQVNTINWAWKVFFGAIIVAIATFLINGGLS